MKNWSEFLEQEKKEKYFIELMEKVNKAYEATSVYPPKDELFSCFELCKYEDLKVVIIGHTSILLKRGINFMLEIPDVLNKDEFSNASLQKR